MVYVRLIPPGRRRHRALPHAHSGKCRQQNHAARAPLLPQVLLVEHAICVCRSARPDASRTARRLPITTTAQSLFTASLEGVSAKTEKIPDLPIVAVAEDEVTLARVAREICRRPRPRHSSAKEEWQRWNDYGIGLFLQGDLKGAQAAFEKVTEVDPKNPDGWVNIGRCRRAGRRHGARPHSAGKGSGSQSRSGARSFLLCQGAASGRQLRRGGCSTCAKCSRNIRETGLR